MLNALFFLALLEGAAWSQSADVPEVFDAASVKPAASQGADGRYYSGCHGGPGSTDPGMVTCTSMGLGGLIVMAYGINAARISGLKPSDSTYDIVAKVPSGASRDQEHRMLQNFLAERFKLSVHREKKVMHVYLLVLARGGPKLKESVDEPSDDVMPNRSRVDKEGFPVVSPGESGTFFENGTAHYAASGVSMKQFVEGFLERRLAVDLKVERPVVDATGLIGKYDFKLMWLPGDDQSMNGPTLPNALENQLGLKLEQKQTEVEILVVDHAENVPVGN
jgi:uncharacterized protein (TIGR03435 family)